MRTNIVIDDALMQKALRSGDFPSKKAAVEEGLRLLILMESQQKLRRLRGKVGWEGDLEFMRSDT